MKTFTVDYYEIKNKVSSRRRLTGSPTFNLVGGATSDFAVQAYLKRLHPNSEININSIQWR